MRSIIEILNLSKNFDNKNILKEINLKITKGESLVIIGKSGSGKSLLMKCVLGILKPSQGEILIKNKNFFSIKRDEKDLILKSIGVTFQGNALFDSMRIWEIYHLNMEILIQILCRLLKSQPQKLVLVI